MRYVIYIQSMPIRNQNNDWEADFVELATVDVNSSVEAWQLARKQFPQVLHPVIEKEGL